MSFLSSKGPDVGGTWCIGDVGMVIGYLADSSLLIAFVREVTMCLDVPGPIAEEALIDLGTLLGGVSLLHTPLTSSVVVLGTMFPPIGKVVDTHIEHGTGDGGRDGCIVKDAWFELLECIGVGQHLEGVVFLPLCIPIELFEFGQVFSKICHSLVGPAEALYFSLKGSVSFSIECIVNHGGECFVWVEGVSLLLGKPLMRVWVWSGTKWSQVLGTVLSLRENDLWVVWGEVIAVEGGRDFPTCHS